MESKDNLGLNEKMSLFYPDKLWRLVPAEVDLWDTQIQKILFDRENPFWLWVERWSDTSAGIAGTFLLFFSLWFFLGERSQSRFFAGLRFVLVFAVFLIFSDFVAHKFLKMPIGRLKPRVHGIIPNFYQALSFPSSHAFNMVFAWSLMRLTLNLQPISADMKRLKLFLFATLPFILIVSWSRIALNEHYPIDVLGGWILGAVFAKLPSRVFVRALAFVTKKMGASDKVEVH